MTQRDITQTVYLSGPVRPPEATRDQLESAFSIILRKLWRSVPTMLAVAFVDSEGECIDYVSSIDPFEAKVAAAHMQVLAHAMRGTRERVSTGEPIALEITTETHDLWVRQVDEEYSLVVLLRRGCDQVQLRLALCEVCVALRDEAGLPAPPWEVPERTLRVAVRPAAVWAYAPEAFWQSQQRMDVSDVLGRWHEPRGLHGEPKKDARVCFRVRTVAGQELTLVHHVARGGWSLRT